MSVRVVTTRTPAALTILRDKVAAGERITQAEALRMEELERYLGAKIHEELAEADAGRTTVTVRAEVAR